MSRKIKPCNELHTLARRYVESKVCRNNIERKMFRLYGKKDTANAITAAININKMMGLSPVITL